MNADAAGGRVRLRPAIVDDLWLARRRAADPEVGGSFNWSGFKLIMENDAQLDRWGKIDASGGRLVVIADDRTAGDVSWRRVTYGVDSWWCWNLGISLLPELRGQGIGTAAQQLLVTYLFATDAVGRIEAHTDVDNHAEQRALEKCGFTREGRVRAAQFRQGEWRDVLLYSILRADHVRR
ncbi:GNAT family N-acetyltransferase [Actinoplanes sp. HUAS TT8]|uniref:GNAT family N-acetyltransferase n=1 Tax=Actinoplanes sp. HUAS TT8 TaxID=3447453 RepID=UPI003F51F686